MICEKRREHLGMVNFGMVEDPIDLFIGITMENDCEKLMKGVRCRMKREKTEFTGTSQRKKLGNRQSGLPHNSVYKYPPGVRRDGEGPWSGVP